MSLSRLLHIGRSSSKHHLKLKNQIFSNGVATDTNGTTTVVVNGASTMPNDEPPKPTNGTAAWVDQKNRDLSSMDGAADKPGPRLIERGLDLNDKEEAEIIASERTADLIAAPVVELLEAIGTVDAISSGIHHLVEGIPVLMNALDEVAKLHPFIGAAVLAFKAVYTLEMKRRDNDRRIIALYVEMKDMMAALVPLRGMKDVTKPAADGSTIAHRLESLCNITAIDIRACSNTCDTYSRKRLLVKVLNGPIWETRLASFVAIFSKRKAEFQFALSIHTAVGIDIANQTLVDIARTTLESEERMKLMLKAFEAFVPADQKEAKTILNKKGNWKELQEDDEALAELLKDKKLSPESDSHHSTGRSANKAYDLKDLKQDLRDDLDALLDKNMETFSRKFEMQKRQITEEVEHVVRREGDRMIQAFTKGPHERIRDPDIHKLWVDMGWKGNVKARHFVLALRDYFLDKKEALKNPDFQPIGESVPTEEGQQPSFVDISADEWALKYLDVEYLQPILEAFDDDASGFISVTEVNKLTTSRPLDWSLLHWIAYWALGVNMMMCTHSTKINEIFDEMFSLLPVLLPENRATASQYLKTVWVKVTAVTASLERWKAPDSLEPKFKTYIDSELERLRSNLNDVRYDVDEMDTLLLVTGAGRIEKNFFPLVRLLLERHLQIFHVARSKILHVEELYDAADTMLWVDDAVRFRWIDLKTNFSHQAIDLKSRFKKFAFGMFEYLNDPSLVWSFKIIKTWEYDNSTYDASKAAEEVDLKTILNYEIQSPITLNTSGYENPESPAPVDNGTASEILKPILGRWTCMVYNNSNERYIGRCFFAVNFQPRPTHTDESSEDTIETNDFVAEGNTYTVDTWKIEGSCSALEDGTISVNWSMTFSANYAKEQWFAKFDPHSQTLSGSWGTEEEEAEQDGRFFFSRMSSEILASRPTPSAFAENRIKALWSFACDAALQEIRRRPLSWSCIKERRDTRHRYVSLTVRRFHYGRLIDEDETKELVKRRQYMSIADARLYSSRVQQLERLAIHSNLRCDCCSGYLGQDRVICLVCDSSADVFNAIDLCGDKRCLESEVPTSDRSDLTEPHLPSHDMMMLRKLVVLRNYGITYSAGLRAIQRSKALFLSLEETGENSEDPISDHKLEGDEGEKEEPVKTLKANVESTPAQKLICHKCSEPVQKPCWYCVDCEDGTLICMACDPPGGFSKDAHLSTHSLVTCQPDCAHVEGVSVENRLDNLTSQVSSLDERMTNLENMLHTILLRVESGPPGVLSELEL